MGLGRHSSLTYQVFAALIAGEVLFAAVLGVTIGAFSAAAIAREREAAMRQISAAIAAGLMPMVADQQKPQVEAQLMSILEAVGVQDVKGICVADSSHEIIAKDGYVDCEASFDAQPPPTPWAVLFHERLVVQPVIVDGLEVAIVRVWFTPPGVSSLTVPALAAGVVVLSVLLLSVPWTAWRLARDVVEPLKDLGQYAAQIAEGKLDAPLAQGTCDEIGELQQSMQRMSQHIQDRDERLQASYGNLSTAYVSLERAKQEIEQMSTIKSNFVAIAAHEIRGPLTTIRLYTQLLERGGAASFDERALEAVSAIETASGRLTRIVSDLMDSAVLERGLMPLQLDDVWIGSLLEDAVRESTVSGQEKGIRILLEEAEDDWLLRGDVVRLRQLLDNLISNAIKYSPSGSQIHVRSRSVGDSIEIEVADQGPGIPADSKDQVFALFGRLDFGDNRKAAGLGLGLAISARIVQAHGGDISYRPNPGGQGTVFLVRLPVLAVAEDAQDLGDFVAEGGGTP